MVSDLGFGGGFLVRLVSRYKQNLSDGIMYVCVHDGVVRLTIFIKVFSRMTALLEKFWWELPQDFHDLC